MKTHILPPVRVKTGNSYWFGTDGQDVTTAWGIIREVASNYRYRFAIAGEVKRDLLRFASLNGYPVYVGVRDTGTPYFYFYRAMADAWLADGGRAWIIAELEARSTRRVIAFPRGRT